MIAFGFLLAIASSRIRDTWGQSQSILVQSLLIAGEMLIAIGFFMLWIATLRPWFAPAQDWIYRAVTAFCGTSLVFVMVWIRLRVLPFVVLASWEYLLFYGGMGARGGVLLVFVAQIRHALQTLVGTAQHGGDAAHVWTCHCAMGATTGTLSRG
jgi:hypothetical protein